MPAITVGHLENQRQEYLSVFLMAVHSLLINLAPNWHFNGIMKAVKYGAKRVPKTRGYRGIECERH